MRYFFLLPFLLLSFKLFSEPVTGPSAKWVIPEKVPFDSKINENELDGGYAVLLADHQYNLMEEQEYYHTALKVVNETGVQEASSISIGYDPLYQKLKIHRVLVWRNGAAQDQLKKVKVEILHQENDLQAQIYNGKLSAFLNLKDIRKGDIIEYDYTITGFNPIYKGYFSTTENVGFSVPVPLISFRLLAPKDRHFVSRTFGKKSINIKNYNKGDYKEISFRSSCPEGISGESNTPGWYFTWPVFVITEFRSWEQVRAWAKSLFEYSGSKMGTDKLVSDLRNKSADELDLIMSCIRFVQDEVRYTGIESGIHSHMPHNPIQVLNQRFGDCKDKSLLLVELLKSAGYDAYPILVSSTNGKGLKDLIADAFWFDHVIVGFAFDRETYFVDPTISHQGGTLTTFQTPDYDYGLRLGSQHQGELLNKLSPNVMEASTSITESFLVKDSVGPVELEVTTVYRGSDADAIRYQLSANSKKSFEDSYLDFYQKLYPGTKRTAALLAEDDRKSNELVVKEFYSVENLWKYDEEKEVMRLELFPQALLNAITKPETRERQTPFALAYPSRFSLDLRVRLPEDWPIQREVAKIDNPAFRFTFQTKNESDQEVVVSYAYESLADEVSSENVSKFYADLEKLDNYGSYQFLWSSNKGSGTSDIASNNSGVSGWNTTFILYGNLLATLLLILVFFTYKWNPSFAFEAYEDTPYKIGSWLILIAIGLGISVPVHLYHLFSSAFFNQEVWERISTPDSAFYSPDIAALFRFEYLFRVYALIFAIYLNVLFYSRRNTFPILYTIYLSSILIYGIVEVNGAGNVPIDSETKSEALKGLVQSIVACAIWIPYIWISYYSKNTFVFRYDSKQERLEKRIAELESLHRVSENSLPFQQEGDEESNEKD